MDRNRWSEFDVMEIHVLLDCLERVSYDDLPREEKAHRELLAELRQEQIDRNEPVPELPAKLTQSPEDTGVYSCHKCGNTETFTGYDDDGCPGEDCECDYSNDDIPEDQRPHACSCEVTLTQDFTVLEQGPNGDIAYQSHTGGGPGAEIGTYNRIDCRECGEEIWNDEWIQEEVSQKCLTT